MYELNTKQGPRRRPESVHTCKCLPSSRGGVRAKKKNGLRDGAVFAFFFFFFAFFYASLDVGSEPLGGFA
jgi:hypothetical protein